MSSDLRLEALRGYAAILVNNLEQAGSGMVQHSLQLLKTAFLMNGGGILAIFTLMGLLAKPGDSGSGEEVRYISPELFVDSLYLFVIGLALAPISMFFSYLNFQANYIARLDHGRLLLRSEDIFEKVHEVSSERIRSRGILITMWIAILACALSIGAFVWACLLVGDVFTGH